MSLLKIWNVSYVILFVHNIFINYSVRHTYLACLACPLWRAETFEAVLHVDAGSTLSTGVGGTFICVWNINKTDAEAIITWKNGITLSGVFYMH